MDICKNCVFWVLNQCSGDVTDGDCGSFEGYVDWDNLDDCVLSMRDATEDTQVSS